MDKLRLLSQPSHNDQLITLSCAVRSIYDTAIAVGGWLAGRTNEQKTDEAWELLATGMWMAMLSLQKGNLCLQQTLRSVPSWMSVNHLIGGDHMTRSYLTVYWSTRE